jgi:nucleotide-binding universal stress UspA family protein
MKTFVISTDFSSVATHAAKYGYQLAKEVKADIILCNAVIVPAEVPQAGIVAWPMEEYNVLMEESNDELKKLKEQLEQYRIENSFQPPIKIINESGIHADVVNSVCQEHQAELVIMGTHASSGASHFIFGDHTRKMIDSTTAPLLVVPPGAKPGPVKKIAFATDFEKPEEDLKAIYNLLPLARLLNAEILITNVYNEEYHAPKSQEWVAQFMTDLSNKANYPHIYYRVVKNTNAESGLEWLCEHGQVDMLAMVHRHHNFFDNLFNGSHTKKIADKIALPLLVIPEPTN